jgi:nucleotide-binding universal stress UspA family protein
MLKKILVGVKDDLESKSALCYAANLARVTGAELTALHVIEELEEYHFYEDVELLYRAEATRDKDEAIRKIRDVSKECHLERVEIEIAYGNPAKMILKESIKGGFDLIVVGSHSKPRFLEFLLGGVAFQIIHYAKRPVLVVKRMRNMDTFLVCLDGSLYAYRALKFAGKIAKTAGARVTLLHVSTGGRRGQQEAQDILQHGRELLDKIGVDADTVIREGPTAEEILMEAREKDYDLIVMGHKGKSAIREFLLGDVVSKVIHHSLRPTLVYR